MDDSIYIVIYRGKSGLKWNAESNGVYTGPGAERLSVAITARGA